MTKRIAVVTGASKGIGFEICKQLASNGVEVILTARDVKRGNEAVEKLNAAGYSDVIFHQLDVGDKASISSFANFIKTQFGKLDILINNAGIVGSIVNTEDQEGLKQGYDEVIGGNRRSLEKVFKQTFETATDCIRTNYYGIKLVSKELIPLLQLSNSARIINVSASFGQLKVVEGFLEDVKENLIQVKGWPKNFSAYAVSKAAVNAFARVLAKKYPNIAINSVCPGYVKTDLNTNTGVLTVEEGAKSPVMVAVVTGANKGIGFEICKQLASNGIGVILTARDAERGNEAVEKLKAAGYSRVIFHQLDVVDKATISSLANFIQTQFGKLDILINNAGINRSIITADLEDQKSLKLGFDKGANPGSLETVFKQTYKTALDCLRTNYYGMKQVSKELIPLLELSNSARIINVSSAIGQLKRVSNENARKELEDVDGLTEEKVDNVVERFLEDAKENLIETKGWPANYSAYIVSKAALNAYTRVLAKKNPKIAINAVCPGFVKTDLNHNTGVLTVEEGAKGPVMLALMPEGGPSGLFFAKTEVSTF
ncbi:(+)-neomenthol dehydrogenase-like [Corylus avellana]|uniref:(+)-neomenthol dehydrogenase-like n=1 Tax=Corylus avellana TaxID=13451 RepID=UPI00286CC4D2|nr:(+)-neomenthol dehydrogenase-like [Corylus avellana]